jgi:hypothetical protein
MVRRLAAHTAHCDPTLTEFDFETEADPAFDDDVFNRELEAMKEAGEIDLPPNLPLSLKAKKRGRTVVLACASGGSLSTL